MPAYLSFRVRLLDVDDPISRSFLLKRTASFHGLHEAIQDACGWENAHMFAFRSSAPGHAPIAGISNAELDPPHPSAKSTKLATYFTEDGPRSCLYEYDFGDDWCHEVKLVETVTLPERFTRRLLGGERAFPPEDCGGTPGYYRCVAAASGRGWKKSEHGDEEERRELVEWLGGWMPNAFDLARAREKFDR